MGTLSPRSLVTEKLTRNWVKLVVVEGKNGNVVVVKEEEEEKP